MAYSTATDLLVGDIPLPAQFGDGSKFVDMAADEIDSQVGHIYVTPIEIDASVPLNRPASLLLKKINNLIASGRIILDLAAGGEDAQLHAYGANMLKEGLSLLEHIQTGKITLTGATLIDTSGEDNTGPTLHNEDSESLVEAFYQQTSHGEIRGPMDPVMPYADRAGHTKVVTAWP